MFCPVTARPCVCGQRRNDVMCKESRRVQLLILSVIFFRFSSLKPCQRWQKMRHLLRSNIGEFLWKNEFCSSVVCGRTVMTKFLVTNLLMRLLRSSEGWRGFMQKFVNYGCKTPLLSSSIHAKLFVKDIATSTTKAKEILYHTGYSDACDCTST